MTARAIVVGLVVCAAACGGRAARGPADPNERLARDPDDVAALLALAAAREASHPSAALAALERAERAQTMLGPSLDSARARYHRLLSRRAAARLARGAASAREDLLRARALGAAVPAEQLARAEIAHALGELRSVDERRHAPALRALAAQHALEPALRGALPSATAAERGALGQWLWRHGARIAALRALTAWRTAAPANDDAHATAYLQARAWWTPSWRGDGRAPEPAHHRGPRRCAGVPAAAAAALRCTAGDVAGAGWEPSAAERDALLQAPRPDDDDPAWAGLIARAALAGELADWRAALTARVRRSDSPSSGPRAVAARALRELAEAAPSDGEALARALVAAIGASPPAGCQLASCLRLRSLTADPQTLPGPPLPRRSDGAIDLPRVLDRARARAALARAAPLPDEGAPAAPDAPDALAELSALAALARRDLPRARARLDERTDRSDDAALAHAQAAALLDLLGDPHGARTRWQLAVDASPEPAFLQGQALTLAHAADAPAALVAATRAAAAAGDPAPVLLRVGRALLRAGQATAALEAAKSALDLADAHTAPHAFDLAHAAATALGRPASLRALEALRPFLAPGFTLPSQSQSASTSPAPPSSRAPSPSDSRSSSPSRSESSSQSLPSSSLWLTTRLSPKDLATRATLLALLPPADPRTAIVLAELLDLASDPDLCDLAVAVLAAALGAPAPP